MAEVVVGVVASGAGLASLATQLFDSAKKLESFRDITKNAPDRLDDLIPDLETMAMILRELEHYRQRSGELSAPLDRCIERCRQCVDKIEGVASRLETSLQKHGMKGKLQLAFREKEIEELLADLERAKSSLRLAHQLYWADEHRRKAEENDSISALHTASLQSIQQTGIIMSQYMSLHGSKPVGDQQFQQAVPHAGDCAQPHIFHQTSDEMEPLRKLNRAQRGQRYSASKAALDRLVTIFTVEVADLGYIKTLIINPGHCFTDVGAPHKLDLSRKSQNYAALGAFFVDFAGKWHGNQPGDAAKAANLTIDVVKGEGVAKSRQLPPFVPVGRDAHADLKANAGMILKVLKEWKDAINSTDRVLNYM